MINGQQLGGYSLSEVLNAGEEKPTLDYTRNEENWSQANIKYRINHALTYTNIQMFAIVIYEEKFKVCIWDKQENNTSCRIRKIIRLFQETMPSFVFIDIVYMGEN